MSRERQEDGKKWYSEGREETPGGKRCHGGFRKDKTKAITLICIADLNLYGYSFVRAQSCETT